MPNLFQMGDDVTPTESYRVASGKVDTPTVNHTWGTVKTWLSDVLSFMKGENNLSEITNVAQARAKLDVYSKGETTNLITNAYNTATAKISNDSRLELICSIQVNGVATPSTIFLSYLPPKYSGTTLTIQKKSTGRYILTHNLNIPINRQSVVCSACLEDSTIGVKSIYTAMNYIKLAFSDDGSPNDTDFNLQFFKII